MSLKLDDSMIVAAKPHSKTRSKEKSKAREKPRSRTVGRTRSGHRKSISKRVESASSDVIIVGEKHQTKIKSKPRTKPKSKTRAVAGLTEGLTEGPSLTAAKSKTRAAPSQVEAQIFKWSNFVDKIEMLLGRLPPDLLQKAT
jgi:hypothetical protein